MVNQGMWNNLASIGDIEPLKIIADERRLSILKILMSEAATLSQLGRTLNAHPAKIRHHLKLLEEAGFVELMETRVVGGFIEKYYRASAPAYLINLAIVPEERDSQSILAFGSHDIALELLAEQSNQVSTQTKLVTLPVGSLDGLIAVRQGLGHLAACHLFDEISGEFNEDYVRHLFPGQEMRLLTLTHRQQGLIIRKGNPKGLHTLVDLTRDDVSFINRQPGSGTRLWLDKRLLVEGIAEQSIQGYGRVAFTHLQVSQMIANGTADAGLGLLAAARQYDLDFIPLFNERFDLVLHSETSSDPLLQPILNHLQSATFRKSVQNLGGYDTQHTGDIRGVK